MEGGERAAVESAGQPEEADTQACRLEAVWDGAQVVEARLVAGRPLAVAPTWIGATPEEALAMLAQSPEILASGPHAHCLAARAACAAAGADIVRPDGAREERAIAIETAQAHIRRLMIDWPALFGHEPRRDRFGILHRRLGRVLAEDAPTQDAAAFRLGGELLDLVAIEMLSGFFRSVREPHRLQEFVECAERGGNIGAALADLIRMGSSVPPADAVALLPPTPAFEWANRIAPMSASVLAAFAACPEVDGAPRETGALARHAERGLIGKLLLHGHRVAARLFARVIDLADTASRLRHPLADDMPTLIDAARCGDAAGLACVETATGLLMHVVRLDGGCIADHAIVPPAVWNVHPRGALMCEAAGWQAPDRGVAELRLRALALSLDPYEHVGVVLADQDTAADRDA